MPSIPRPGLEEAARRWLENPAGDGPVVEKLTGALTDFVDKRFRGAASQLRRVHDLRLRLIGHESPLETLSEAAHGPWDRQTLGDAAAASAPPDQGRLLFHLVRALSPAKVLEMGTNIGISAAYIALGLKHGGEDGRLISVEASGIRLDLARQTLDELEIEGVELVEGYFDDLLPSLLDELERVDMAFVDGNHQLEPTVAYFEQLRRYIPSDGLVVLDDIRWSDGMLAAWERIVAHSEVATVVDLGRTGLVVLA